MHGTSLMEKNAFGCFNINAHKVKETQVQNTQMVKKYM